jgi:hypothetical protein
MQVVTAVVKARLGIFTFHHLGKGLNRGRRVHCMGSRVTDNHQGRINKKRAMGRRKGMMDQRAEENTKSMMYMKEKEEEVMLLKGMEAEDMWRNSFMKDAEAMVVRKGMKEEEQEDIRIMRIMMEKDKESMVGRKKKGMGEEGAEGEEVAVSIMKQKVVVAGDMVLEKKAMEEKSIRI